METTFDVPARTFLRVVYGDDGFFFRRFHHETGECPDASVPPWTARSSGDATRVVVFTKTMSLPSVIERLLGSGTSMATLRFEETQTFAWDPATSTACVRSTPTLVSPRSESFQTEVAVYVCPDGEDPTRRCAMRAVIKVTASGTWALQPVVEKLMETRASASFREWVRFADAFLEENYGGSHVGDRPLPKLSAMPGGEEDAVVRGTAPAPATTPPPSSSRAALNAATEEEEFPSSRPRFSGEETPGASASSDFETDDDDFDDARSVGSTSSFHSVRSAASSFGSGVGSWFGRRSSSGGGTDGGGDREAGENNQNGFDVGSPAPPSRTRSLPASPSPGIPGDGTGVKTAPGKNRPKRSGSVPPGVEPGSSGTTPSGVPEISSRPRADDAFANSWFMQTVLKDLAALRARDEDTGRLLASLEENVCAVRAENASLRAEVRRLVNGAGGAGAANRSPSIRGSLRARADGKDAFDPMGGGGDVASGTWVAARWVTGLGIAVGVGYVAGQVLARNSKT